MSSSMSEIRLTNNEDAIARLKRLGLLVKDQYGWRYDAMFNAMGIPFWLGHVKRIPTEWAESLVDAVMPIDEKCVNCKGNGSTQAGLCHICKGTRWTLTNRIAPLFKLLSTEDLLTQNPQIYQEPPKTKSNSKEAEEALTSDAS